MMDYWGICLISSFPLELMYASFTLKLSPFILPLVCQSRWWLVCYFIVILVCLVRAAQWRTFAAFLLSEYDRPYSLTSFLIHSIAIYLIISYLFYFSVLSNHIYTYISVHVHMLLYITVFIHTWTYIYIYVRIYMHICMV
jgi:hypothetical protein